MAAALVGTSRPVPMRSLLPALFLLPLALVTLAETAPPYRVEINVADAPEHAKWAEAAEKLGSEWFGRIVNLISFPRHPPSPRVVRVQISKEYKGVAYASGDAITIADEWVRKNPTDSYGVIIHELTHVVQSYPGGAESWLVEGIADYVRFGIYEARPLDWFPKSKKPQGYRDSYQVAAGFLLWLEAGPAPGIVRRLNTALRERRHDAGLFEKAAGKTLDALWQDYVNAREQTATLPANARLFRHQGNGGGVFEHKEKSLWIEYQKGAELWRFTETARTEHHVELLDEKRNLRLRLTAAGVFLQRGRDWGLLYPGKWESGKP